MHKRYFLVLIVAVMIGICIWKLSSSYAFMTHDYIGNNIVSGDKWGLNILKIDNIETNGKAILVKEPSTISTSFNFDALLYEANDKISFEVTIINNGIIDAELYDLSLSGLSLIDGENIVYQILPLDDIKIHGNDNNGSIILPNEEHHFKVEVSYNNASINNNKEYNLNLGGTIIYKQV